MQNEKLNKLLCKLFGHKTYEEVYAKKYCFHQPIYRVVHQVRCDRCGEILQETISRPMHRSEMLKNGWFIEN